MWRERERDDWDFKKCEYEADFMIRGLQDKLAGCYKSQQNRRNPYKKLKHMETSKIQSWKQKHDSGSLRIYKHEE